jgi:signal transduction histidine kinase
LRRLLLIALMLAPAPSAVSTADDRQRQVLVVYSTRRDAQIALVGERDLPRLLEDGLGGRLDYYAEFIDPSRFSEVTYEGALATFLRQKYQDHRFDVIISIGDDATKFVGTHREVFTGTPPVVFFAASRAIDRPADAAGIISEVDLKGTVNLAAALDPGLRHVFVVGGAEDNNRSFVQHAARPQLEEFASRLDVTYFAGLPTKQLEDSLRSLPPHSMVFYLGVDRDGAGEFFHPLRYLDKVVAAANAPTYSWVDSTIGLGVVGGMVKNQGTQVRALAGMALRVLRGTSAGAIPLSYPNLNENQVDWRQMRRWGFSESRLPAGTVILFRDPSAWERYRPYILTALILMIAQSALIMGLLIQRSHRRKAEEQLLESQARLRASFDRIRDLGGRLLKAQETERAYVARELHDDVSQQLALIEMDVKLLGHKDKPDATMMDELLTRVQSAGRSIRDLSHRLHPAKLRLIGLVVALKGLQSEMSQSGIEVVFTHENVPQALPPDLTLCLFRVAQEGLQNAVKYSRARRVTMHLAGSSGNLTLTIEDDGVGFDVAAVWGRGLGLMSMKERIETIDGSMAIRSTPGAGTRLDVRVPLAGEPAGSVAV